MHKGLGVFAGAMLVLAACGQNDSAGAKQTETLEKGSTATAEMGGKLEALVTKSATDLEGRYKDITARAKTLVERQQNSLGVQRAQATDQVRALIGPGGLTSELDRLAKSLASEFESTFADIDGGAADLAQTCAEPSAPDTKSACAKLSQARDSLTTTATRIRAVLAAAEVKYADQRRRQHELLAESERLAGSK